MDILTIIFAFAWCIFWCWACIETAGRKGFSQEAWGTAGFLLGPFAFVAAIIRAPRNEPPLSNR